MSYESLPLIENDLRFSVVYSKLIMFSIILGNREINVVNSLGYVLRSCILFY